MLRRQVVVRPGEPERRQHRQHANERGEQGRQHLEHVGRRGQGHVELERLQQSGHALGSAFQASLDVEVHDPAGQAQDGEREHRAKQCSDPRQLGIVRCKVCENLTRHAR